jgi:lipopolysaccharide export system protein LptA
MRVFAAAGLCLLAGTAGFADSFSFSADRVQSVLAVGKEKTILTGKARVKSERLTISADLVEISGKNYDLLVCKGNVDAVDTEKGIHLQSPTLTYDRNRSLALLQGPSILEDKGNHVILKADWIQDDGDKGITLAQVNVRILKEGLACRAEYAIYRRGEHILELSGAPRVVKNGDEYRASRMVVNTDTEEIKLEGMVSGSVHTENAKNTKDAGTPVSPPPDTTAPSSSPSPTTAPTAPESPATTPAGTPSPATPAPKGLP